MINSEKEFIIYAATAAKLGEIKITLKASTRRKRCWAYMNKIKNEDCVIKGIYWNHSKKAQKNETA